MDFESYKNALSYPMESEFTTTYFYKAGKTVAVKKDGKITDPSGKLGINESVLSDCVKEKVVDKAGLQEARRKYGHETARLEAKFKEDLFAELGISGHPMRDKLFSKAWSDGHANGYHEVFICAQDLVELIELPKDAVLVTKDGVEYGSGFRFHKNAIKIEGLAAKLQEVL